MLTVETFDKRAGCTHDRGHLCCRTTPPLLYTLGLLAFGAGAGIVYYVPDESTAQIAGQLVGAGILLSAGIAALFAGNFLNNLQK